MIALMLLSALAELFTIGALLPFLSAVASPDNVPGMKVIASLLAKFGVQGAQSTLLALAGLLAVTAILSAGMRLLQLWASQNFVYGVTCDLAVKLFSESLHQPYANHIKHNSSEIIATIGKIETVTSTVLAPLMAASVATIISVFIVGGLIAIDPWMALLSGGGFAAIYLFASMLTRRRLLANGVLISTMQGKRVQTMQEGLGGIRDVLIDQSQAVFVEEYARAELGIRDGRALNAVLANAPRFLVEGCGTIMIAVVAILMAARPDGILGAIPILGALALGAQRLLPLVQQMFFGWAIAIGNKQNLLDAVDLLDREAPAESAPAFTLPFEREIVLDKVGFAYSQESNPALSQFSLVIPKGARIGIVGKTGSGKSTLMDILIGLLDPTEGEFRVDGVRLTNENRAAWRKNIAHVPQAIFLSDSSIASNIAFGVKTSEIDHERVRHAAEQAELSDVIANLPKGYETRVGERGIQLSGGQRQRIGIARALYKQAQVLVFDEATSALDTVTESAVMGAIAGLDRSLTVLLIAHRLSTLEGCDTIIRLEAGRIVEGGETA